jgi:CRISPR-associated protein Cas1
MLGKSGDRLTVRLKDELLAERRLMDVSQVCLYGSVLVSAQALRELTVRGIPVCHFSYGGWFHALTAGFVHNNVQLRIRQFAVAADAQQSLRLARWFIAGKIRNARTLLRRHLSDGGGSEAAELVEAAVVPADRRPVLEQLQDYRRRVEQAGSAETLLGLEGLAAKAYFQHFFGLLRGRFEFDVAGRNRRPPRDPVNAVLSFMYSLLVKELTVVLQSVGFDPLLGFLHRPRFGRPGLALDVAEEYRPLIADSATLMAFNNGELGEGSFLERAGAVVLTEGGRKSVIAAFERRMSQEVTHPIFGYRVSYRRILEVQARLLARAVVGELPEYVPFCTR